MIVSWVKCIEPEAMLGVVLIILGVIIMAKLQVVLEANGVKFPDFLQEVVEANDKVTRSLDVKGVVRGSARQILS